MSDLATAIDADPGYVSRLLSALADELLITRVPRGPVEHVEWESLLGQITAGYSLLDSNKTTNWIASAGPEQFLEDLVGGKSKGWAVTGSFAASPLVSVAAPEIAVVYAEDPERIATATRLRPVRNGGNVVIALPYDQIVLERTWTKDNAIYVSPSRTRSSPSVVRSVLSWISIGDCVTSDGWFTPLSITRDNENLSRAKHAPQRP